MKKGLSAKIISLQKVLRCFAPQSGKDRRDSTATHAPPAKQTGFVRPQSKEGQTTVISRCF